MKELCCVDNEEYCYIFVFVGYGDEKNLIVFEFIYNWDIDSYDLGNVYGYIVIEFDDIYKVCEDIKVVGGNVS